MQLERNQPTDTALNPVYHKRKDYEKLYVRLYDELFERVPQWMINHPDFFTDFELLTNINIFLDKLDCITFTVGELHMELAT